MTNKTRAREVAEQILANGGGTYDLNLDEMSFNRGYLVGVDNIVTLLIDDIDLLIDALTEAIDRATHSRYSARLIGGWVDDTLLYLDYTVHYNSLVNAANAARTNEELALWDCRANQAIDTCDLPAYQCPYCGNRRPIETDTEIACGCGASVPNADEWSV